MNRIAVVRVRGRVDVKKDVQETLKMLNLTKTNHCVIIDDRDSFVGMLQKLKIMLHTGRLIPILCLNLLSNGEGLKGMLGLQRNTSRKKLEKILNLFAKIS